MKKTNNKGFSLVELIVVVAIMAVLMVVIAPQMLKYVERTRIQRDNSAIAEIANAAKIAMADETINGSVTATVEIRTDAAGKITFKTTVPLEKELADIIGDTVQLQATAYKSAGHGIDVAKDTTTGEITITGVDLKQPNDATKNLVITY